MRAGRLKARAYAEFEMCVAKVLLDRRLRRLQCKDREVVVEKLSIRSIAESLITPGICTAKTL
jgi:hypothetical protein